VKTAKKIIRFILMSIAVIVLLFGVYYVGLPGKKPHLNNDQGMAFVKSMGSGINISASFDCFSMEEKPEGFDYETAWGQPHISRKLIKSIAEAGMKTVRLPVTWSHNMGGAPDYTVNPVWMARVKEVVDWILAEEMYIILNTQNDDLFWQRFDRKYEDETLEVMSKLWEQICKVFESEEYGEKLIFEPYNEPRKLDSFTEWMGGDIFNRAVVTRLNKKFLEIIRSHESHKERWVLLPSYAASSDFPAMWGMSVPEDDKVIVSLHIYHPLGFVSDRQPDNTVFTDRDAGVLKRKLANAHRMFVKKGIPVLIGEFGAVNKNNNAERAKFAAFFVKTAREYGMSCLWWDNGFWEVGSWPTNVFGVLDRESGTIAIPEIVAAIVDNS